MNKKNEKEYETLQKKIIRIREELKMAALDGDFKENADWQLLNKEKEILQNKIKKELKKKQTIATSQFITYQLLTTKEKKTIELTNQEEIDPGRGRISPASPLGLALTNKKVGQIVEVKTPHKTYQIKILQIK